MTKTDELDVRVYVPIKRHEMLLQMFRELPKGESFTFINDHDPKPLYCEFRSVFEEKFAGEHTWTYRKQGPDEYVIHVAKRAGQGLDTGGAAVVDEFDVRPHSPAKRHAMVFEAFDRLRWGEAFIFTNDHDPKPLYYQIEAESEVAFAEDA